MPKKAVNFLFGLGCILLPQCLHAGEIPEGTGGQYRPTLCRSLDYYLETTHIAVIKLLKIIPTHKCDTDESISVTAEFKLVKVLSGSFQESDGCNFKVKTKIYYGPILSLPVQALDALWLNGMPERGEQYIVFAKRRKIFERLSLSNGLEHFRNEEILIELYKGYGELIVWALSKVKTGKNTAKKFDTWVTELERPDGGTVRARMLWVPSTEFRRNNRMFILFPVESGNRDIFRASLEVKSGPAVITREYKGDLNIPADEVPLHEAEAFQADIDLSEHFVRPATPVLCIFRLDFLPPSGKEPGFWEKPIRFPDLEIKWGGP
jgi:hypothetical protein